MSIIKIINLTFFFFENIFSKKCMLDIIDFRIILSTAAICLIDVHNFVKKKETSLQKSMEFHYDRKRHCDSNIKSPKLNYYI